MKFRAAGIQMTSGDEIAGNTASAITMIRTAQSQGASLIATPEMTTLMEDRGTEFRAKIRGEEDCTALPQFRAVARELGIWLLIGSAAVKTDGERAANRSYLIGPDGAIAARYDKIHMFDVDLGDGSVHRESRKYRPGDQAVAVDTSLGRIGMTVCYDLRFPALYKTLAQAGAEILCVPSAFTKVTGQAHWHVLLRARAIECGAFVIAPAQCGTHPSGRETYGHSLIISPWGEVLADGGIQPGLVLADIDTDQVLDARRRIPNLSNDRPYTLSMTPHD